MNAAVLIQAQPAAVDAFEQNRQLGRGVNIIGYDPIWRQFDSDFILYDIDRDAWVEPIRRALIPGGRSGS